MPNMTQALMTLANLLRPNKELATKVGLFIQAKYGAANLVDFNNKENLAGLSADDKDKLYLEWASKIESGDVAFFDVEKVDAAATPPPVEEKKEEPSTPKEEVKEETPATPPPVEEKKEESTPPPPVEEKKPEPPKQETPKAETKPKAKAKEETPADTSGELSPLDALLRTTIRAVLNQELAKRGITSAPANAAPAEVDDKVLEEKVNAILKKKFGA